jgi:hypothetical protein
LRLSIDISQNGVALCRIQRTRQCWCPHDQPGQTRQHHRQTHTVMLPCALNTLTICEPPREGNPGHDEWKNWDKKALRHRMLTM